jgi:NADH-quinone oxidoreductase subunit J
MQALFYVAAAVAVIATLFVVSRSNAIHALLYFVVSLLAVALMFYLLGAPFVAALEVLVYAGAIMVLFVFIVMLLGLSRQVTLREREWEKPTTWAGPGLLATVLIIELGATIGHERALAAQGAVLAPKEIGQALFGPYLLGVELASMVLLAGVVGAAHVGRRRTPNHSEQP